MCDAERTLKTLLPAAFRGLTGTDKQRAVADSQAPSPELGGEILMFCFCGSRVQTGWTLATVSNSQCTRMKVSRASTGVRVVAVLLYDQEDHDCGYAVLAAAMSTRIASEGPLVYVRRMYRSQNGSHRSGCGDHSGPHVERRGECDGSDLRL
jgi:hypothetical protein